MDRVGPGTDLLFIQCVERADPIAVEFDRPGALRPRPVGFWLGTEFYPITRVVATRREHDASYYRVVTDRGAFDLRRVRRINPVTMRAGRCWELCAELQTVRLARRE